MKHSTTILVTMLVVAACGGPAPKTTLEWNQYQDPYFPCSFTYPKDWQAVSEAEKVALYSHADGPQKFFDPSTKGEGGSQLLISFERAGNRSLESYLNEYREGMSSSGFVIKATDPRPLSGLPAYEVTYTGRFDEHTRLTGIRLMTIRDSVLYNLSYSGFDDSYDVYRSSFDSLVSSFVFPRPRRAEQTADPSVPSDRFIQFSNDQLSITHPDNFDPTMPSPKGEVTFSFELKGYRQDCTIRIDVLPAKGLTSPKVFEQNEKFYKVTRKGSTTIDGVDFPYLEYSPAAKIESRVYFGVKNDKVWRIISNVYQPLKTKVDPAFQKTVQSLRIK